MKQKLTTMLALLLIAATGAWADDWTNIIKNSDMEGTDVSCFYVHEQAGGMYLARITDGIGKDGSRAIKLQSSDNEANSWDTQFNMRLPYVLPAGTQYKLSFDYKSDQKAVRVSNDEDYSFGFQISNEPGQYVWWTLGGWPAPSISISENDVNKWLHFEETYTVPADCDGVSKADDNDWLRQFRTIYINLAGNKVATKFIIDNIKVEIQTSVLNTLTPEPVTDPGLMILAPPYTVTMNDGGVDTQNWTITPAEATTTGVDKGTTITATYSGTKKVLGVKAEKMKSVAEGKTLAEATVGMLVGSDGKTYAAADKNNLPEGVTAVALVCYVSDGHGLALALADESSSKMTWNTAKSTCSGKTPTVTGCTWKLATKDEWNNMINAAGGFSALRDGFSSVGGTNMLSGSDDYYWSSTTTGSDCAWCCTFSTGNWTDDYVDNYCTDYVRACLAF